MVTEIRNLKKGIQMTAHPQNFSFSSITAMSKILGDSLSGSDITALFQECRLNDNSGHSTKWRRLEYTLSERQKIDGSPNAILRFIKEAVNPVRFINKQSNYDLLLIEMNKIFLMSGLKIEKDGAIRLIPAENTISEVKRRYSSLIVRLRERDTHPAIYKYCNEELFAENYFHVIFEAVKSLSDRVREITELTEDGSDLYNKAFSIKDPWIALNKLETETERNQQNGLKEMLSGIYHLIRNVTAHETKIKWVVEEESAIDILMVISLLHKYLDQCFKVPRI